MADHVEYSAALHEHDPQRALRAAQSLDRIRAALADLTGAKTAFFDEVQPEFVAWARRGLE